MPYASQGGWCLKSTKVDAEGGQIENVQQASAMALRALAGVVRGEKEQPGRHRQSHRDRKPGVRYLGRSDQLC